MGVPSCRAGVSAAPSRPPGPPSSRTPHPLRRLLSVWSTGRPAAPSTRPRSRVVHHDASQSLHPSLTESERTPLAVSSTTGTLFILTVSARLPDRTGENLPAAVFLSTNTVLCNSFFFFLK